MLICGVYSSLDFQSGWFNSSFDKIRRLTAPQRNRVTRTQMGVWSVSYLQSTFWDIRDNLTRMVHSFPLFRRVLGDVYRINPPLATFYIISRVWAGVEPVFMMYISNQLIEHVETAIKSGKPDTRAIANSLIARIACIVGAAVLDHISHMLVTRLSKMVQIDFTVMLLRGTLRLDVQTANGTSTSVTGETGWRAFEAITGLCRTVTSTFSNLLMAAYSSRTTNSNIFLFMCIARPIFLFGLGQSLWEIPYVFYTINKHYKRATAFLGLTHPTYRSEVLTADLGDYIIEEYTKSAEQIVDLSDDHPAFQFMTRDSAYNLVSTILGDLPIMYCAYLAITQPGSVSVSQIAIWEQSSNSLRWSIEEIISTTQGVRQQSQGISDLYSAADTKSTFEDGIISYPRTEQEKEKGMSFEVKNLTFSYSGSQSSTPALEDVSFSIKSGDLVVVVGANGSGKSTIVKLLGRVYECASGSGSILVDGLPISEYRMADIRRSTAMLTQDHRLFDALSLGENIGLGYIENVNDKAAIMRAAEMGGALTYLEKLKDGLDTVLDPQLQLSTSDLPSDEEHPLNVEVDQLPTLITPSGGESQRLVASRTFMRFQSGQVKFVAVDEPSSALDPEGELTLFDNLLKAREGKTLVFVTHRFGHLTKHADLILCMKDGRLAESGTHLELLRKDGEYAKMYNIQASAFVDNIDAKASLEA